MSDQLLGHLWTNCARKYCILILFNFFLLVFVYALVIVCVCVCEKLGKETNRIILPFWKSLPPKWWKWKFGKSILDFHRKYLEWCIFCIVCIYTTDYHFNMNDAATAKGRKDQRRIQGCASGALSHLFLKNLEGNFNFRTIYRALYLIFKKN